MDVFLALCQGIGLGLAVGALAGAIGQRVGSVLLVAALAVGAGIAGLLTRGDEPFALGAAGGAIGVLAAAPPIAGIAQGSTRRAGTGAAAVAFLLSLAAIAAAAVSTLVPPLALAALAAVVWLGWSRRRRAGRKHEGLRVLAK